MIVCYAETKNKNVVTGIRKIIDTKNPKAKSVSENITEVIKSLEKQTGGEVRELRIITLEYPDYFDVKRPIFDKKIDFDIDRCLNRRTVVKPGYFWK